ncbi:MAG: phytanoyl-CoA dioxygenase family protein [Pseudomonadota bacterium]
MTDPTVDPQSAAGAPGSNALSPDELGFFKRNGYLIVRNALNAELCARTRERLWSSLPAQSDLRRDDATTHVGPFSDADRQLDVQDLRDGYRWQLRSAGTERLLIDLVFSERLRGIAEALLGPGTLQPPKVGGSTMGRQGPAWPGGPVDPALDNEGVRGIYCTLPYGDRPREPDAAHTDGHPFNLGVVGLIDDVPPDGGAFKVWPGSHRRLYPTFALRYDQPRIPYYDHLPSYKGIVHTEAYLEELERIVADTPPVDCHGKSGDVVFWHHRTAHMAGHNYSSVIRQAVLYDFCRTDLDEARQAPADAPMWRDWSEALQSASDTYPEAFAATQNLQVS